MNSAVQIAGLNRTDDTKPWANGDRLLAFFDCEVRGFKLLSCLLIRTSRGGLLAQAPRGDSQRSGARAITITDQALRLEMAQAAFAQYQSMGGVA